MKLLIIILVLLGFSCKEIKQKEDCFYVKLSFIWINDSVSISIDNGIVSNQKIFKEPFRYDNKNHCFLIKNYCTSKDTVKIYVRINNIDTVLYAPTKEVRGYYVGSDLANGFVIFPDYHKGGLRERMPED